MTLPKRKPTRLKGYDYSSEGAYFITICAHNRKCIFSDIVGAIHESPENKLNSKGEIADYYINNLNARFGLIVDKYVIMPNHIHLIVIIDNDKILRAIRESPLRKRSLTSKTMGYLKIWNYIDTNPQKWNEDCFYAQ